MSFGRPIPSHIRNPSLSQNVANQSPALLARVNEKKTELANLKELQALSASVADQMQMLEDKLSKLADGTEAVATVLANWHSVLRAINLASSKLPKSKEENGQAEVPLPQTLVRIPTQHADLIPQSTSGSTPD